MSKQNECERCLNSRVICSENGLHSICTLSPEKIAKCFTGKENHFKEDLHRESIDAWMEEGDKNDQM